MAKRNHSDALRDELLVRAQAWAVTHGVIHYQSLSKQSPTVLFEPTRDRLSHGNFYPDAWWAINADPEWRRRLDKRHPQIAALPPEKQKSARELDSSNSSDALLMNIFCFPGAIEPILRGLGLPAQSERLVFGYKPRLALKNGAGDRTEIDMKIGTLIFEAKLTEKDFTSRPRAHVMRYEALEAAFDIDNLPVKDGLLSGYQVIRNVLAAMQLNANLVILVDQRRPDLRDEWEQVHSAINNPELRDRCLIRTWQNVAAASPKPLTDFLASKYGIQKFGHAPSLP